MLSLETCQKLKDAGWPQVERFRDDQPWIPTLEELLEAIRVTDGVKMLRLYTYDDMVCKAYANKCGGDCVTGGDKESPSEAAAALWLKLKGVA